MNLKPAEYRASINVFFLNRRRETLIYIYEIRCALIRVRRDVLSPLGSKRDVSVSLGSARPSVRSASRHRARGAGLARPVAAMGMACSLVDVDGSLKKLAARGSESDLGPPATQPSQPRPRGCLVKPYKSLLSKL